MGRALGTDQALLQSLVHLVKLQRVLSSPHSWGGKNVNSLRWFPSLFCLYILKVLVTWVFSIKFADFRQSVFINYHDIWPLQCNSFPGITVAHSPTFLHHKHYRASGLQCSAHSMLEDFGLFMGWGAHSGQWHHCPGSAMVSGLLYRDEEEGRTGVVRSCEIPS